MPSDRKAWVFTDELTFIKGLGSHGPMHRPHRDAVMDYLNAIRKREDWLGMDPEKVIKACTRELS